MSAPDEHDAAPTGGAGAAQDRALLAAIIESTVDAVVSVDLSGHVTSWNQGAERLYGHLRSDAVGAPLASLVAFRDDTSGERWRRALAGEPVAADEIGWRRDGVDLVLEESLSPVRAEDGTVVGAASIARDVTQRRRVADELSQVRRDLERNNARLERSNADLEQFAYVASHDLSEPLRAIAGMVSLLQRRYRGRLDADADEYIDFAVEGCDRMRRMIDDVLLYARAGHGDEERESVDATAVAREVVSALRGTIEPAGAEIVIGDLPVIRVGRNDFNLVFQNLLSNAVKFRHPDRPPRIEITAERTGDEWTFCVLDNGLGVDPQVSARVFRMFQRLHPEVGSDGTGIGLAIAERIVSGLGGRIWVAPRPGGGSRFCFTVPDRDDRI
jgi:PAS domain S-box-containing protein